MAVSLFSCPLQIVYEVTGLSYRARDARFRLYVRKNFLTERIVKNRHTLLFPSPLGFPSSLTIFEDSCLSGILANRASS